MKNRIVPVLGLSLLLLSACSKKDYKDPENPNPEISVPAQSQVSDWQSAQWKPVTEGGQYFFSSIADNSITNDVISNGLVLAFMKKGNSIESLPVEENGVSWYYQVSEGNISILYQAAKSQSVDSRLFKHFVISAADLTRLEKEGHSKGELSSLSFDQLKAIL